VRLRSSEADLAEIVRALDAESLRVEQLQLHQASLDDVFLAKTGRSLEGAGDEDETSDERELALEPA
jgi:ABC-2 type transport system ATP-binding protein